MATDGHGGEFVPAGPTHDLTYEPDKFAVKTILAVPAAVIVTGIIAFIVTDLIFGAFFAPKHTVIPPQSEQGAAENAAPLNERFDRISSTNPKARVLQPRLEGIQQRQVYGKDGNPKNTDPSNMITQEMTSTQPTKEGNSPRYRAEDLRPDRVAATARGSTDPQTGTVRVPVDKAIELASDPRNADWAKALPSREGALPLDPDGHWDRPKESNGGNARFPAPAKPTPPKKEGGPEAKKEPDKKEPEKKEPDK
jgi:hypothetical protein